MAFLSRYFACGPLSDLSVTRNGFNPDNAERLRRFRQCFTPELRNAYPWPYLIPKASGKVVRFPRKVA